ncbi:MAG: DUF190 domain-containing protein [Spirochaetes bacterium]|nr:DUF190 domain-containing protein [Spirochaetota bacterium]
MLEKFVNSKLLRIFLDEADHYKGKPLYEYIILKARELKINGATIIKAIEGYGTHFQIHTNKLVELSENLPIIIEIVDSEDKLDNFLNTIEPILKEVLITIEDVKFFKINK